MSLIKTFIVEPKLFLFSNLGPIKKVIN